MKKADSQDDKNEFLEKIYDHPSTQWFITNGKIVAIVIAGVVASLIMYSQMFGSKPEAANLKIEKDFIALKKSTHNLEREKLQSELLQNIQTILAAHPELQPKYDAPIAQILINLGNIQAANPYIDRTLKRTKSDSLSFYADYSKVTQLISTKEYEQALKVSNELKIRMLDDLQNQPAKISQNFGNILFEFNLLRIAFLFEKIGNKKEELKAWKEFSSSVMLSSSANQLLDRPLIEPFIEGGFNLENYIKAREKLLTQ